MLHLYSQILKDEPILKHLGLLASSFTQRRSTQSIRSAGSWGHRRQTHAGRRPSMLPPPVDRNGAQIAVVFYLPVRWNSMLQCFRHLTSFPSLIPNSYDFCDSFSPAGANEQSNCRFNARRRRGDAEREFIPAQGAVLHTEGATAGHSSICTRTSLCHRYLKFCTELRGSRECIPV